MWEGSDKPVSTATEVGKAASRRGQALWDLSSQTPCFCIGLSGKGLQREEEWGPDVPACCWNGPSPHSAGSRPWARHWDPSRGPSQQLHRERQREPVHPWARGSPRSTPKAGGLPWLGVGQRPLEPLGCNSGWVFPAPQPGADFGVSWQKGLCLFSAVGGLYL